MIVNVKQPKNRYLKHTHLSERQIRALVRCFAQDLTALDTADFTGIHRNTVNRIFKLLRMKMASVCEAESPLKGEVEVDESYFGPRRIPGKRGRGAAGKTIVFGLLKRGGKVYTEIIPDAKKATLQAVIRGKVDLASIIYTDSWRGYDGLVDVGYDRHLRVRHADNEFAQGGNHINGIESFWSYAKRRLVKFNGVRRQDFYLFLKETEFRFNHRHTTLSRTFLRLLQTS